MNRGHVMRSGAAVVPHSQPLSYKTLMFAAVSVVEETCKCCRCQFGLLGLSDRLLQAFLVCPAKLLRLNKFVLTLPAIVRCLSDGGKTAGQEKKNPINKHQWRKSYLHLGGRLEMETGKTVEGCYVSILRGC